MSQQDAMIEGVEIHAPVSNDVKKVLNKDTIAFLALLHRTFNKRRLELLQRRVTRQAEIDKGVLPDFLPETKHIRENDAWKGAPPAPGLIDRRVEITGPTDRKMVVNALNSNVWTYMADFEGLCSMDSVTGLADTKDRLKCSNMGEHDKWTGQSIRCHS